MEDCVWCNGLCNNDGVSRFFQVSHCVTIFMHSVLLQTAILDDDHGPYSYPISTFTYLIIHMHSMKDCEAAVELCR